MSGRVGVGKTYAWNHYVADAKAKKQIKLPRYSYVSLFGINSIAELKSAIFENSVDSSETGSEPTFESFYSNTIGLLTRLGKQSVPLLQEVEIPYIKNFVGPLTRALSVG